MTVTMLRPVLSLLLAIAITFQCTYHVASLSDEDSEAITCGSVIKLEHKDTKYYLNSQSTNINAGSNQQLVSFVKDPSTHNTLWWVRPAQHSEEGYEYPPNQTGCRLAMPIACNTIIRLTHQNTYKNLHSHNVKSVLSSQQEVTGYGEGDGRGDAGDNWRVVCLAADKYWKVNEPFRLQHVDTGAFLGTGLKVEFNQDTCGRQCPIMGHLESFGRASADVHSVLLVQQGIHLSK